MDAMATLARSEMFVEGARDFVICNLHEMSAESHLQ